MILLQELFLLEEAKKLTWDENPNVGWWRDAKKLRLYHGTNIVNIESVSKTGLSKMDPDTGMISLAIEPFTARGYASMYGGESDFRKAGRKAKHVPMNERAIFVFDIPMDWILKHYDPDLSGNMSYKKRLEDKSEYDNFTGPDYSYYALTELRVNTPVPAKFIVGYMIKP